VQIAKLKKRGKRNMKKIKKLLVVMLALTLMVSAAGCGQSSSTPAESSSSSSTSSSSSSSASSTTDSSNASSGETYTFTLALDSPEDTVTYLYAKQFADLVSEKSNGNMTIQIYSNGQLGGDREIAESVQAGNIDFVTQNTAPQVNFIPELAVFDMPSVFPDVQTARKALDLYKDTIAPAYEKAGFKIYGFADQGFRTMSTNKKVTSVEDIKGQKIRTMENPYHVEYWKALGANPTPMAFGEVYIGLQQGTIDAQENPYETIVSAKLYEQQKYIINTNHILHIITLIGNPDKYNSLPADYQAIIDESAAEATVWAREQADARVADRVKIMEDYGCEIVDLDPAVLDEMAAKAEGVWATIRSTVGDDLVDKLLEDVAQSK
jgi:tripartite ATP-independent transporter DctP family solute receptor